MVAITKEQQIVWDIYRELYKEANPIGDFDKLVEEAPVDNRGAKYIAFMDYSIPEILFEDILDRHLKGKRLTKLKQRMIRNTIIMGCSPKFTKDE